MLYDCEQYSTATNAAKIIYTTASSSKAMSQMVIAFILSAKETKSANSKFFKYFIRFKVLRVARFYNMEEFPKIRKCTLKENSDIMN